MSTSDLQAAFAAGFMAKCAERGVDPHQLVKAAARGPEVYIVKGNPRWIRGSAAAAAFYKQLAALVRAQGYTPKFHAGAPHTAPDGGIAWIGHSRGEDRLRFAPEGVKTLALGAYEHPAARAHAAAHQPVPPPLEHYQVTDEMRVAIQQLLPKVAPPA